VKRNLVSSMRAIGVSFSALSILLGMAAGVSAAPGGVPGPSPDAPGQIKKANGVLGGPLLLKDEGSFFVGGEIVTSAYTGGAGTGSYVRKQMYVDFKVPAQKNHPWPIVFLHGGGQPAPPGKPHLMVEKAGTLTLRVKVSRRTSWTCLAGGVLVSIRS
jgi:hypothetical protein